MLHDSMLKIMNDEEINSKTIKFYEISEEYGVQNRFNNNCETIYNDIHYRQPDGRYMILRS